MPSALETVNKIDDVIVVVVEPSVAGDLLAVYDIV